MDLTTLKNRIELGEEYLLALEKARNRSGGIHWRSMSEDGLRCLKPWLWSTRISTRTGKRKLTNLSAVRAGFRPRPVGPSQRAWRIEIWLSACPLENQDVVHVDHLFPYSLGGPTLAANQLFLCPVHNRAKASDIHLFPWELGEPGWLRRQVERIRSLLL